MRTSLLACALVVLAALPVRAQGPTRDARAMTALPKGSAELSVLVSTDEASSQPLRRVSVAIQAGDVDIPRIGVTDDGGRVVFRDLTAGNYRVTAVRPGYVRTFYGSSQPGRGPGVAVTVLDGQRVSDVRIKMLRGSVLTGVVRNTSGSPAPNQQVQAISVRSSATAKRAMNLEGSNGTATTDDRGMYRIFGLAPGDYIVSLPLIAVSGQDMRPVTAAELAWADKVASSAAGPSPTTTLPLAPPGAPMVKYAPVYYPGTSVAAEASIITLGPSEERSGLEFGLVLVATAQVRGRVIDTEGGPQNGITVSVRPTQADSLDLFSSLLLSSARTGADGTFTIQGVKPGAYTLTVRATPSASTPAAATAGRPDAAEAMRQALASINGGASGSHWADEDIIVAGRDVSDVTLTLRPGMTVRGKIVYEATTKAPPTDLSRTSLSLSPATGNEPGAAAGAAVGALLGGGTANMKIAADGTFGITGVPPGEYHLNTPLAMLSPTEAAMLSRANGGWVLKSAVVNGRDIADAPLVMTAGADVSGVVVTFTDQPSELSGTVIDAAGRPTPGFPIIVFSTDRAYWTNGSRRVQQVLPASSGKFTVTGLPAGEYYVSAVTSVDRTELYDPAFLEQLAPVSFKITIKDGEKKTQDLKLGR